MRKLMVLATVLAMMLVAATPAFAQSANAVAGDVSDNVQYNAVSQNVFGEINAVGVQYGNVGDNFAGDDLSQSIAQEQDVSVWVVNASLNTWWF